MESEPLFVREAAEVYEYKKLKPITHVDPAVKLAQERSDRWQPISIRLLY